VGGRPDPRRTELSEDPINATYPNTARIWNYQLGGKDHFAIDREAADAAVGMFRQMGLQTGEEAARLGRHLLQRMVDYLLGQGIRQFLDLGSGLPNMANTHQVAHRTDPQARIVYVDRDPMVSTHSTALMAGTNVVALAADLRHPQQMLENPEVRKLIDFDQPVAIMFICMLHCLWDEEDPWGVVRQFRDAVVPGSYLALSHLTNESNPEAAQRLFQLTQDLHWDAPLVPRSAADIARMFDGFTLVEPGLVSPTEWRRDLHNPLPKSPELPTDDSGEVWHYCGVGVKDQT
jgi:SAM-dependent methyltransferase